MYSKGILVSVVAFLLFLTACNITDNGMNNGRLITTPSDRQEVRGTISILLTPPDNFVVDHALVRINGTQLGSSLSVPPYKWEWDTRSSPAGTNTISAELYGSDGSTKSDSIIVFVNNN